MIGDHRSDRLPTPSVYSARQSSVFSPLTPAQIERIIELMFNDLRARFTQRRLSLDVSDEARRFIAAQGFDPVYGARPLRRFIAHEVETRIGRALLSDAIPDGVTIRIELKGDELIVTHDDPSHDDPQSSIAAE